ncbi:hypothetical protein SAMN05192588_0933 [Nonlabens sp. Hel1_33_55]|uniref:hypothetical protein n=1 Tax=Nonlabens sp. Hel1_33_55 TaxID=1336802 RepID=UPI000875AF02|nr:hypothetical protein [Nonlabens sp. Hel1_33_55]SCY05900.1 hypothetical protein SAMN05192588_0933 [Nonlabens sp. Hel1_33_55]
MKGFFTFGLLLFTVLPAIAQEIETPNNKTADSLFVVQHEAYAHHSFETARELLKTALLNKRMARSYEPHYELGDAEFALENFEAAAKAYAKAIQLAENQVKTINGPKQGLERSLARIEYIKEEKERESQIDTALLKGLKKDVPYSNEAEELTQFPIYEGCEIGSYVDMKRCMNQALALFIVRNFKSNLANRVNLYGRLPIEVNFTVDPTGALTNVKAKSLNPQLEHEALLLISLVPQMKPGLVGDKTVSVNYLQRILFVIE